MKEGALGSRAMLCCSSLQSGQREPSASVRGIEPREIRELPPPTPTLLLEQLVSLGLAGEDDVAAFVLEAQENFSQVVVKLLREEKEHQKGSAESLHGTLWEVNKAEKQYPAIGH